MRLFTKKPKCPYCGLDLEKKPTRKKKCPNCSEFIFVRKGELYTEKQVKDTTLKGKWLSSLRFFGATEDLYIQEHKNLSKRYGFEASVNDTIWSLMNSLLREQQDRHNMGQIYTIMGKFVVEEEGKDPKPYIQQAHKIREEEIKERLDYWRIIYSTYSIVKAEISTANDELVCDVCKNASKRTYTIDEFLKEMPIPMKCINPLGCRCALGEHVE